MMLQRLKTVINRLSSGEQVGYFALGRTVQTPRRTRLIAGNAPVISMEQGGGGYVQLPNGLIIGGAGGGGGSQDDVGDYKRVAGHGFGLMMLGYLLEQTPHTRVYPYIGIGAGGEGILFSRRDALKPGELVARDPHDRIGDIGGGPMFHLGFVAELRSGGKLGLMVGLQVGTVFYWFGRPRLTFRLLVGGGRFRQD